MEQETTQEQPGQGETVESPASGEPGAGDGTGDPGTAGAGSESSESSESHGDATTSTGEGDGADGTGDDGTGEGDGSSGEGGTAKALKALRTQVREANAALTATRKAYAESMATQLHVPGDLWNDGATVAQVLDDSGNVDRDKVAELQNAQLQKRPGLAAVRNSQHGVGGAGNVSYHERQGNSRIDSWSGAAKSTKGAGYRSRS